MNKQEFYRLEEPRFEQYEFAFYEVADDTEYGDFPKCPKCKSPLGMRRWLPPRRVYLEQARRIGDFIFGAGGGDMLVTERFKSSFEKLNLKGIKEFNSVEVLSIKPKTITRNIPVLFEAVIAIRQSKVLYEKMGVIWTQKPSKNCCEFCGGGTGKSGEYQSYQKIVLDESSPLDSDIFYAINFPGSILLSQKAFEFINEQKFENAIMTPCSKASLSFELNLPDDAFNDEDEE